MIPDFLLNENNYKVSKESIELKKAMKLYEEHFGRGVNTEPSTWSVSEWVDALNKSVESDIPLHIMYNWPEGDDIDY